MLLHFITNFAEIAGAEASLKRFVFGCPSRKHTVVSLMEVAPAERLALEARGVVVVSLGARNAFDLVWKALLFSRRIASIRPKVVICWMYHANFFGRVACAFASIKPRIFWNIRHSLDDFRAESPSTKIAILANRLMSGTVDGVIYCSQRSRSQHQAFGFSEKRSEFIPNGYDFALWPEASGVSRALNFEQKISIGAAGRFHPAKDYRTLLKSAALVLKESPYAEFVFAGRGVSLGNPEFSKLVGEVELDLGRCRFLGEVADMSTFYAGLDVFVLSSATEAFPNVLAEAMAHGVPCVSTDVGDAAFILDGIGAVVPSRSPTRLAAAIGNLISLPREQRHALGVRARASVFERFAIQRVVGRYLEFINA